MKLNWLDWTALVLVIIGALNWGLIGAANINLVTKLLGTIPVLVKTVYIVVGLGGLYTIYLLYSKAK